MSIYPIHATIRCDVQPELKLIAAIIAMAVFDAHEGDDEARDWLAQDAGPWLSWLGDEHEVAGVIAGQLRAA